MEPKETARLRKPTAKTIAAGVKYAARYAAEKARQQQRYCDAFALWRCCAEKYCRRHRRCCGNPDACLGKAVALDRVPHRLAWQTRQDILTATPRNIGAPERAARQCMPIDFYLGRGK
jgi:hypothetical protein